MLSAVNVGTAGTVNATGFDTSGKGPSTDLGVFQIVFGTSARGTATLSVTVNSLTDASTANIGTKVGIGGTVTVN
jgi:hypothetical protein